MLLSILKFPVKLLYTIWFDIWMLFLHITGIPFGLVMLLFGQVRFIRWLTRKWVRALFIMGGKWVRVSGMENLTAGRHYLVVANHSSFYDIHTMLMLFPDMGFLAKKELFSIPLIGNGLRVSRSVPIDRGNFQSTMNALKALVEQTADGFTLGIFPEGTRTRDGRIGAFKRGFVRILRSSGLELVPVTLNGYYKFKPKNRRLIDPFVDLAAVIHKPVSADALAAMSDEEVLELARNTILSAHRP